MPEIGSPYPGDVCSVSVVANRPEPLQGSSVRTGCARPRSSSCSSGGSDGAGGVQCVFCKRNGETREFFTTHMLKVRPEHDRQWCIKANANVQWQYHHGSTCFDVL